MNSLAVTAVASACFISLAAPSPSPWPAASAAIAPTDARLPQEMTRGVIKGVDADNKVFIVHTGAADVDVVWNDQTVFMFEGRKYKWDDIVKENSTVIVTHRRGVASKVEAVKKK